MASENIHIDKLDDSNYYTWAVQAEALLSLKECWSAVTAEAAPNTAPERARDSKALALIRLAVKPHHLPLLKGCNTAREAWEALERLFRARSIARRLQLRIDINSLRLGQSESLSRYFSRARMLMAELEATGGDNNIAESDVVLAVLNGLPKDYDMIRTVLVSTLAADRLTLDSTLPALLTVESNVRKVKESGVKAYAANTRPKGQQQGKAPQGGGSGPSKEGGVNPHKSYTCYKCGKQGHIAKHCRSKGAKQQQQQGAAGNESRTADTDTRDKAVAALTAHSVSGDPEPHLWLVDSGAGSHITPYADLLVNAVEDTSVTITFGNKSQAQSTHRGEVWLQAPNGSSVEHFKLTNVLLVPDASGNLFSVKQADKAGATCVFKHGECRVYKEGALLVKADESDVPGLYAFKARPRTAQETITVCTSKTSVVETAELWHARLSHAAYSTLEHMARSGSVQGINVGAPDFARAANQLCEPCVMGKQVRAPFPTSTTKTQAPLELLHTDVAGPMPAKSLGGSYYYFTVLDDYTGLSCTCPVASKSDVTSGLIDCINMLERQSGLPVKALRSDNGGEYCNSRLEEYLRSKGIVHQTTAPHTPQQNGKAERLNRTLMERTRALLSQAGLPASLWAEAVVTVNYVRNRTTRSGTDKTPWELFYGAKPNVSHLRIFGAPAFILVPSDLRTKLDMTSVRGTFVGYEPDSKAYRFLVDGKIIVRREAVFDELALLKGKAGGAQQLTGNKRTALDQLIVPSTQEEEKKHEGSEASDDDFLDAEDDAGHHNAPDIPNDGAATPARRSSRASRPPDPERMYNYVGAAVTTHSPEPQTYAEAMASAEADDWRAAMIEEMGEHAINGTWELEEPPKGTKLLDCKWVFKRKRDSAGNIVRYKARLVAKGCQQREGIDFTEVFAPTSKHATLRALLSRVAVEDWELQQLDVRTAFLKGELEEDIWMKQPPGFVEGTKACHLRKSLYGLRQAPRAWHDKLSGELKVIGCTTADSDPGLYTYRGKSANVYILVYVDDILIAGKDRDLVSSVKAKLAALFDIRDMGEASTFVGIEIVRDRSKGELKIVQRAMVQELAAEYGVSNARSRETPFAAGTKLEKATEGDDLLDTARYPYCSLVGSMLYLMVCTRPDIAQSVGALTRYMSKPNQSHWTAAQGVLRYLASTPGYGIIYTAKADNYVMGYCDADHGGDTDTRRSTTGFVFNWAGGAISWSSRLQPTVAVSTTEAEYMAASSAVKEALYLRKLCNDLGAATRTVVIYCDNQATITLLKNPVSSARSKHIDIMHHFARERVARGEVEFRYIESSANVSDIMTKALERDKYKRCRVGMAVG
jgi:hypothetical protein